MNLSSGSQQVFGATTVQSDSIPIKGTNPLYAALNERRGSYRPQPKNTDLYEVTKSDTLTGIAARFNTTPSELVNLNKFGCRTIFPGQIIYVPEVVKDAALQKEKTKKHDDPVNGRHSPKPGHVQRVGSFEDEGQHSGRDNKSPSLIAEDLNQESLSKFLKINAKHITDGEGVASGVLLITPNHIMFDPNVSDPLVIEHGADKYGVVAPMHMVVRAALYPDIVRMKAKDSIASPESKSVQPYHSKISHVRKSYSEAEVLDPRLRQPSLDNDEDTTTSVPTTKSLCATLSKISECSLEPAEKFSDDSMESAVDMELVDNATEFPVLHRVKEDCEPSESVRGYRNSCPDVPEHASKSGSDVGSSEVESSFEDPTGSLDEDDNQALKKKSNFEKTKQKFQKGLRKLSITDGFLPGSLNNRRFSLPTSLSFPDLKIKKSDAANHTNGKKAKLKDAKQKSDTCVASYTNMVEEKPQLFTSLETVDEFVFKDLMELIPRPAKSFNDNPLYLCLHMGRPKSMSMSMRLSPVMDFHCKLKKEYWFSIPRSRVDNLYWFFLRWTPEKYGDTDVDFDELGFLPIEEEDELENEPNPPTAHQLSQRRSTWAFPWRRRKSDDVFDPTKHEEEDPRSLSWELVPRDECDKERSISVTEIMPEVLQVSDILDEDHIKKLNERLPARAVGYAWTLIYSTAIHGFSLKTLYREMAHVETPVLLVVCSTSGVVFGAMLSGPLKISDHFYGSGESFLFTFHPEFKCFRWSGENVYFMKGNTGSFAIGASDGQFGLWLDDDLYHGCTKACKTFRNESLCDEEDFVVKSLEAWGFV